MLFGVSKSITEHIYKGEEYSKVRKLYSVNIVYFELGKGDDYVYHGFTNFTGLHTHNELNLDDEQREFYGKAFPGELYPEYYIIRVRGFDNMAENTLDEWIYYLKNNKIRDDFTAQGLDKAREVLAFDNLTDEEKQEYWHSIETDRIKQSEIETALFKGRVEEKREIAKNLIKKGMSVEDISDATGLSKQQIKEFIG
jgi:predicted transposase/invertase (TIGR01784 family)